MSDLPPLPESYAEMGFQPVDGSDGRIWVLHVEPPVLGTATNVWIAHYHTPTKGLHRWSIAGCGLHQILRVDPLTLDPSLACEDGCPSHGFIRDGIWSDA